MPLACPNPLTGLPDKGFYSAFLEIHWRLGVLDGPVSGDSELWVPEMLYGSVSVLPVGSFPDNPDLDACEDLRGVVSNYMRLIRPGIRYHRDEWGREYAEFDTSAENVLLEMAQVVWQTDIPPECEFFDAADALEDRLLCRRFFPNRLQAAMSGERLLLLRTPLMLTLETDEGVRVINHRLCDEGVWDPRDDCFKQIRSLPDEAQDEFPSWIADAAGEVARGREKMGLGAGGERGLPVRAIYGQISGDPSVENLDVRPLFDHLGDTPGVG